MNPADWGWQVWVTGLVIWAAVILLVVWGWAEFCQQRRRHTPRHQPGQTRDALWPSNKENSDD